MQLSLAPPLHAVRAMIFDTDGVVTDSAQVHAAAWKDAFDDYLAASGALPFDAAEDYRRYVDGRARMDGVVSFLAARGLELPMGTADDPPGSATVHALAAAKERAFLCRLRNSSVVAWPGTVRLLHALADLRVPMAAVSASRHARGLLHKAAVLALFTTVVDGNEAARLNLPGKPDPALFLEAARRLDVRPASCAVVEDALAGVEAGRRGGFRLVIGVDRSRTPTHTGDLRSRGADIVVDDLDQLIAHTETAT